MINLRCLAPAAFFSSEFAGEQISPAKNMGFAGLRPRAVLLLCPLATRQPLEGAQDPLHAYQRGKKTYRKVDYNRRVV